MKKVWIVLLIAGCVFSNLNAQTFTLKSKVLGGQATSEQVASSMGCTGKNLSPELYWENVPQGTKSFAITMYDLDAPTGSGFWHWIVFDIPLGTVELVEGAGDPSKNLLPPGAIQGNTDIGQPGYVGPCPPAGQGDHQYIITLYALNTAKLGPDAKATPPMVGFYLHQAAIAKSSLVFYYKR